MGCPSPNPLDKFMPETKITLPQSIQEALAEIVLTTGKSEQQLIAEALSELIQNYQTKNRLALMRKAKGMWADREDIPNLEEIRQ
jgi:metal-responsive CopG/Arc/MetJ family transcriptional regulator